MTQRLQRLEKDTAINDEWSEHCRDAPASIDADERGCGRDPPAGCRRLDGSRQRSYVSPRGMANRCS